jgi:hypothetical protein
MERKAASGSTTARLLANPAKDNAALTQLRRIGIRTATSLCDVARNHKQKGPACEGLSE